MRAARTIVAGVVVFTTVFFVGLVEADERFPAKLSIVLQIDQQWDVYVSDSSGESLLPVTTVSEPRTPTVCWEHQRLAYLSAAGALREIDLAQSAALSLDNTGSNHDRVLLEPTSEVGYAQPAYTTDCNGLFVVELKQGKSVNTDIVLLTDGHQEPFVTQRSAQFEPFVNRSSWLYYASVACVVGCQQIIQEIWRMHTVSRIAEQVTLTNAISREPVADSEDNFVYFSSNRAGYFHIWELNRDSGEYRQLTRGNVIDSAPALDNEGTVYFIRQTGTGTELHRLRKGETSSHVLPLPVGVVAARDLEIK